MEEIKNAFANEQEKETAAPVEEFEPKKEKKQTNEEKLKELKDITKDLQGKIKDLQGKKDKTEDEKAELKKLKAKLSQVKIDKAKQQKKVDNAKTNAVIRAEGKKLAERKQEAINKVLDAEGLNTENGVKGLIALRRVCMQYEIKGNRTLEKCLEYVKQNAPQLINNNG